MKFRIWTSFFCYRPTNNFFIVDFVGAFGSIASNTLPSRIFPFCFIRWVCVSFSFVFFFWCYCHRRRRQRRRHRRSACHRHCVAAALVVRHIVRFSALFFFLRFFRLFRFVRYLSFIFIMNSNVYVPFVHSFSSFSSFVSFRFSVSSHPCLRLISFRFIFRIEFFCFFLRFVFFSFSFRLDTQMTLIVRSLYILFRRCETNEQTSRMSRSRLCTFLCFISIVRFSSSFSSFSSASSSFSALRFIIVRRRWRCLRFSYFSFAFFVLFAVLFFFCFARETTEQRMSANRMFRNTQKRTFIWLIHPFAPFLFSVHSFVHSALDDWQTTIFACEWRECENFVHKPYWINEPELHCNGLVLSLSHLRYAVRLFSCYQLFFFCHSFHSKRFNFSNIHFKKRNHFSL